MTLFINSFALGVPVAPPGDISDAIVLMDFAAGVYAINGVTKTAAEMVDKTDTISAAGLFIDWNTDTEVPVATAAVLSALAALPFTVLIDLVENDTGFMYPLYLHNAALNNAFYVYTNTTTAAAFSDLGLSNSRSIVQTVGVRPALRRLVVSNGAASLAGSANGGGVTSDAIGSFTGETVASLVLGGDSETSPSMYGHIKRVVFLPLRTDAELSALSAVSSTPEGLVSASLAPLVSVVSGTHGVVAAGSVVLAPLQSMLAGDHGVAGNGAAVLASLQALVIEDASNIAAALAPLAVAITTAHGVAGLASVSLAALAVSADGLHGGSGSVNATLAAFAASLVGDHGVAGSGAATLAPIVASVTGTFGDFVTWSPVKSSPSMSLSNSDKTATCTVASRSAIATSPILSNAYWEVECLSGGSGNWLLGVCLGSSYAAGILNALPEGLQYNSSGTGGAPLNVSYTVGDVIGFAFNPATAQLWVKKNGTWLGSDPAGAAAFTFNPGRIYYPSFSSTSTRAVTIGVLSSEWGSAAPSGYGELSSGNAPAFAWNPSDKNANLALSASNTIATKSSTGAASARMGTDFCSGKQVFAVQLVADGAGAGLRAVGINDLDDSLSGISGSIGFSVGYRSSGAVLQNNSTLQTYASWGTVGDILMIATEHASSKNAVGKVWFGLNGTWNGDPAAGTGSVGVWPDTGANRIAFITCGMTDSGDAMQMIPWPYAVPSGFTAPSIAT